MIIMKNLNFLVSLFFILGFQIMFCQQNSSDKGLFYLREKYSWPTQIPNIPVNDYSFFGNHSSLSLLLNKKMKLVVELGSWLGASTRFLLDKAPSATVIAIDHWEGSYEHKLFWWNLLPTLYESFLANCWHYKERLIPMKTTTIEGLEEIFAAGLMPDLIYLDAAHDYASVTNDLEKMYACFPSSILTGDDWSWNWNGIPDEKRPQDDTFPTQRAIKDFAQRHNLEIRVVDNFWMIV